MAQCRYRVPSVRKMDGTAVKKKSMECYETEMRKNRVISVQKTKRCLESRELET